jgi:hypothetical protein
MAIGWGGTQAERDDPGYWAWRLRRSVFILGVLIVVVLPVGAFAAVGKPARAAAIEGVLVGYAIVVLANSLSQILLPAQYERWRSRSMEGGPASLARVGEGFDGALGLGSSRNEVHPYRRLRLFGITLLIVNAAVIALIWWISSAAGWL